MYFRIRDYCLKKFIMQNILRKVLLHTVFRKKENKQYILQDGCGDHLGCMYKQDLEVKKNVRNDFLTQNSQRQVILHIVL